MQQICSDGELGGPGDSEQLRSPKDLFTFSEVNMIFRKLNTQGLRFSRSVPGTSLKVHPHGFLKALLLVANVSHLHSFLQVSLYVVQNTVPFLLVCFKL